MSFWPELESKSESVEILHVMCGVGWGVAMFDLLTTVLQKRGKLKRVVKSESE